MYRHQKGHILAGTTVLMAVAGMVVVSSLDLVQSSNQTIGSSSNRSTEYFHNEKSLGLGVGFLRDKSTSFVQPFSRSSFYSLFDRSAPSVGSNDTSSFTVPTKIKLRGTNKSGLLTNSSSLGLSEFPTTIDTATGANVSPLTLFGAAPLGQKKVRVTLVDAIPVDPSKDFGDPDLGNPQPQTDFKPIYRIDSMDGVTQGGHLYGYTVSSLQYEYGVGFYGRDRLELRQPCDSYISNNGPYSSSSRRANCSAGSNTSIAIHSQTTLYGTARTNGSIAAAAPYGGAICSNFPSCHDRSCTAGTSCQGSSCQVAALPNFSDWSTYCPNNQGSVSPASGSTLTVAGNAPNQKCWNTVTIGNNRVVTLTSTTYPYFIDTLNISNTGRLNFAPSHPTGTITLYVRKIVGDRFNGNQVFNINNKPYQLRLNYLGSDALTFNGTAAMSSFIVAPYAPITVGGNFTFSGGIKATSLVFNGSGSLHYDESGDITTLKDVTYTLRNTTQRYR
jgi:hypothetical protein